MKKRILYLDEPDRECPNVNQVMLRGLMDAKLTEGSWLRRMWWKLSGRGPRYYLVSGSATLPKKAVIHESQAQ